MLLRPPIDRRIILGLLTFLLIFLLVKWSRMTTPEFAQDLAILPLLATNSGRAFFPPAKEPCSFDATTDLPRSPCAGFPTNATNPRVHVILKTGASERGKTRTALSTLLACAPALTIVSDMRDEIDGHEVHDVLADLPPSYALDNAAWSVYEAQKAAAHSGEDVVKTADGWRLDRFKFLPMVEAAFARDPDADWYFFVEVDTYFLWDTLYRLLERLDANERHYVGSAVPGSNHTFFAYGGAGLILSGGLVRDLLAQRSERLSVTYEQWVRDDCCGDALLAYVLREELGVRVQNAYPTLSGEAMGGLGVGRQNWCMPLLTLHRVSSELMGQLWRWERCRPYNEEPIRLSTFLDFALSPLLSNGSTLTRWDNFSNRRLHSWSSAHSSASDCAHHCAVDKTCLQWTYANGRCRTADRVKRGRSVDDDVVSGWDLVKLESLGFRANGDSSKICYT